MKPKHIFSCALALPALTLPAPAGTSADYRTDFETTGMSAGGAASAGYEQRSEAGAESGSTATGGAYAVRHGFAGQLYTVESVVLPEMDPPAPESSQVQLYPVAYLDDLSVIIAPEYFTYQDLSPWTSTSATGLMTTAAVYDRVTTDIYLNFEDVDNSGTVIIEDSDQDNYGAFGGDGAPDYSQILSFGSTWTPAAAGRADADGDGLDNTTEYFLGYDPRNAASRMNLSAQPAPGGSTQVTFGPVLRAFGIGPRVRASSDLVTWQTLTGVVNLPAANKQVTDAAAARRFYRVQNAITPGGYNSLLQYGHNDAQRPSARRGAAVIWTDHELLVWGGDTGAVSPVAGGARFFPATDTWTPLSTAGAPAARIAPAVVWTGAEMIVYGGQNPAGTGAPDTGGRYDPATDAWSPLAASGVQNRPNLTGTWTGTEIIFAGGDGSNPGSLTIFNPNTNTWRTAAAPGTAPAALQRSRHTAVWTGRELLLWGGTNSDATTVRSDGWRFDPASNVWSSMSSSPLSARASAAAVWTGSELIIWGGASAGLSTGLNDGARYNPLTNSWTVLPGTGAPSARFNAVSAWTGRTMVVWGGESAGTPTGTGSAYDPVTNAWTALPAGLTPRSSAGSAWSGDVLFMFGGTLTGGTFTQELQAWVGAQSLVP